MSTGRLEAFSDGVIAIIITIMVLELKAPAGHDLAALRPLAPVFSSYVLSFVLVGIYWNNHHHLLQASRTVNGHVLWANLYLLFCLSLVPFTTIWMGESHFATLPVALYGTVLFLAGTGYFALTRALVTLHGQDSTLATALGRDLKGTASLVILLVALAVSFWQPRVTLVLYVLISVIWFIPDRRIERTLSS